MEKYLMVGCTVHYPELKHCWIEDENGYCKYQRYYLETIEDLENFLNHEEFEHVGKLKTLLVKPWREKILNGEVILLSDCHPMTTYPNQSTLNSYYKVLEVVKPK